MIRRSAGFGGNNAIKTQHGEVELIDEDIDHAHRIGIANVIRGFQLGYVREGDTLVVHSMDRLARNLDDLRRMVQQLTGRGVRIEFVKESLAFTGEDSPMANLLLSVMGAFAEFERALIRERQREGISLAKQRGVYRGRKKALNSNQVEELQRRVESREPKAALAREFGISRATLYEYLRAPA